VISVSMQHSRSHVKQGSDAANHTQSDTTGTSECHRRIRHRWSRPLTPRGLRWRARRCYHPGQVTRPPLSMIIRCRICNNYLHPRASYTHRSTCVQSHQLLQETRTRVGNHQLSRVSNVSAALRLPPTFKI